MAFLSSMEATRSNNSQAVCQFLCCCNKHNVGGWTMEWKEIRMKEFREDTTLTSSWTELEHQTKIIHGSRQ